MEDIILYKKQTHPINLNNSGTMNQQNLDFTKRTMLFDVIREHTNLVHTIQGYPNNDISDVEMTIDCVIMSRKKYNEIVDFKNNLLKEKGTTVEQINEIVNFLNFPKLEP